jgi:hypothetical protein
MKQHKWHKEIKAWADGAEIEAKIKWSDGSETGWHPIGTPDWESDLEYRIKPPQHCCCDKQTCSALKEPSYLYVYKSKDVFVLGYEPHSATNMWETEIVGKIKLEEE